MHRAVDVRHAHDVRDRDRRHPRSGRGAHARRGVLDGDAVGGVDIDFPFQKNIHQLPQQDFIDCLYDLYFARTAKEPANDDFKSMLYARFGRSIAEKFLVPYNEKLYATDLAKMIEAPIFHVNGDDPEAVVLATQIAMDYRVQFKKDIVVDIICYRKLGHNEQDTPALTQPLMYKKIGQHPGTRKLYGDKLVVQSVLPAEGPDEMVKAFKEHKVEVITLTPAEYDNWIKVARQSSYPEFAKEVPDGQKLIDEALSVK